MPRMPWVKYVLMPEIRCLLNWKKGNLCRRSPCRSRTQIYYNNTGKLLTVMRILRMFRYKINCGFNSTLMLSKCFISLKSEENPKWSNPIEVTVETNFLDVIRTCTIKLFSAHSRSTLARANEGKTEGIHMKWKKASACLDYQKTKWNSVL